MNMKKGLYVGFKHADSHHLFSLPLHGKDQVPNQALRSMRQQVLQYTNEVTKLGRFSLALGLRKN